MFLIHRLSDWTSTEGTSTFHHSDLMGVQSEIENHIKLSSGINVSKLKLKEFKAPNVASITTSGKVNYFNDHLIFFHGFL